MKKFFKRLAWAVGIFIALDAALVLALPHIMPIEKIEAFIQDKVREQTGRELAFGDAHISFWPTLNIELDQVTLSNPAWAQQKSMASLGKAQVEVELTPLLDHHIIVKKFILNQPVIYLETGADGKKSWDFTPATAAAQKTAAVPAAAAPQAAKNSSSSASPDYDLRFGRVQLSKGQMVFIDQQKKTTTSVDGVNIDVTLPDLKSPLKVKGALTYRGKQLNLDMDLDRPLDFFNGRTSSGQLALTSDIFTMKADGAFATEGTFLKGDIEELSTNDLAALSAWVRAVPPQKMPFGKVSFAGATRLTKDEIILKEATLALDDVQAKGDVDVEFSSKPNIFARLSLNKLNLDRFTGAPATTASSSAADGAKASAAADAQKDDRGWSIKPLDFSGLKTVDANLKLQTQGFSLRGTNVGPSELTVQLAEGKLHFTSSDAALEGGQFASDLRLNVAGATPAVSVAFNMTGVQAQPILATFAHFKKLSGTATAHVTLTGAGVSQKAMISSLAGKGDLDFKNGELQGLDMAKIAKLIQQHSDDVGVDDGSTRFVDLTGTFTIARGIISNTDMRMKGTVVQATGQGIVDLPKKNIQYKAIPSLATSSTAPPSLSIPVKIAGPFSHIKVVPDYASTIKKIIKNPKSAKALIKNVGDNVKQNAILQKILNINK